MKKYILIILILLCLIPINTLVLSNRDQIYFIRAISPNENFAVRWIHSVELEPWEEHFTIDSNQIMLYKTRFKAFGAGVPDYAGNKTYMEDDYIVYDGINTYMDNLAYGISKQAQHILFMDKKAYLLYEFIPEDMGLQFDYKKIITIQYIYHRIKSNYKIYTTGVDQFK